MTDVRDVEFLNDILKVNTIKGYFTVENVSSLHITIFGNIVFGLIFSSFNAAHLLS